MAFALWIVESLRAHGCQVAEVDGWRTRGRDTFTPKGVVLHHTAGAKTGAAPSLNVCINGRADLPGPLCQVLIGRDGICHVIAAGRANHAGSGGWRGLVGNGSVFGIEVENVGTTAEPWTPALLAVMHRACAALLAGLKADASMLCAHREWAPGRKIDPHSIDMNDFRNRVALVAPGPPLEDTMTPELRQYLDQMRAELKGEIDNLEASIARQETALGTVLSKTQAQGVDLGTLKTQVAAIKAKVGA